MRNNTKIFWFMTLHTKLCAKPLRTRFDKIDRFIKVYNGTKYLVLFGPKKYDAIYNRIRYFISQKSGITYVFAHNYARIKIDSYDSLPVEKTVPLHNVKNTTNMIFLEK